MTPEDRPSPHRSDLSDYPPALYPGNSVTEASGQGSSALPSAPGPLARSIKQGNQPGSGGNARRVKQLVGKWSPEISHYGLTSAALVCDQPVVSNSPGRTSLSRLPDGLNQSIDENMSLDPPNIFQGKRAPEEDGGDLEDISSPGKRARLAPPKTINLDTLPQLTTENSTDTPGITSPLFFSNSKRFQTARPASFSSSEAAALMMRRIVDDQAGTTTVHQLPHGHVGTGSPTGMSSSTPGSVSRFLSTSRTSDAQAIPPALQHLEGIGVIELLEQDQRPTFIIDLANIANFNSGFFDLLFVNAALRASEGITETLSADSIDPVASIDFCRFKAWILSFVRESESMEVCLPSLSYGGISWTCSTLRKRYRVVSGNVAAISITPTSPSPLAAASSVLDQRARGPTPMRDPHTPRERSHSDVDYFGNIDGDAERRVHSVPRDSAVATPMSTSEDILEAIARPSFDWTRITVTPDLPSHIQLARSVDWSATSLGPLEEWSDDLRSMSNLVMGSPHPAAMWWGPDFVAIYNEAYTTLAGQKHPRLMGARYPDSWAEIWDGIKPVFDRAWNDGQATMKHDDRLFVIRNGFLEETFFNWSIVPLVSGDGSVVGIYNPAFENTRRKVNERRMLTLREVGEQTSLARDVKSFWGLVQKGLEYNEFDVPFALIYSVGEDLESEVASAHSGSAAHPPQVILEASVGVPTHHPAALRSLDLRGSHEGFAPYMRRSIASQGQPIVLRIEDGTLPRGLIDGLESRGFGDPCRTVVVFPVHPTTAGESVVGFIVMGVNPRRPYDEDYDLFIHLLSRQLATSMASVVLFEEEIKRGRQAALLAALDRQELSMQLRLRTQEAVESEYKFTRMAEFAPVGMFIANADGSVSYCNDMWWDISRHPRSKDINTWMQSVREEDRPGLEAVWKKLVTQKDAVTHAFRFKYSRQADSHSIDTWVLMSAYPEKDETGTLKSIFGCITDITQQKWAENVQNQRREEAVELKRQQENFIDITSHEMRNPLSAILQCADEITNSLSVYREVNPATVVPSNMSLAIEGCIEAAQTISLCAKHQKRIVDDILTLSKLDSQLFHVTPASVRPVALIQKVLRMFESELNANDIRGEFHIEKSFKDLEIDLVRLDHSRLTQVLINLMTNAIKFTHSRENRSIIISLGASTEVTEEAVKELSYFPSRRPDRANLTDEEDKDWGAGEKVNLHIAVTDTGPGLDEEEKKVLFQRFSQASPDTCAVRRLRPRTLHLTDLDRIARRPHWSHLDEGHRKYVCLLCPGPQGGSR